MFGLVCEYRKTLQLPVIVGVVGLGAGGVALDHVLALVHVQDLHTSTGMTSLSTRAKKGFSWKIDAAVVVRVNARISRVCRYHQTAVGAGRAQKRGKMY